MTEELLFSEWRTYEKVVSHDYMHHVLYFDDLVLELRRRDAGALNVLDLGCGDARPALALLNQIEVTRYVGIDESPEALRCAARALEGSGFPVILHAGDMMAGIDEVQGAFDLIIASYSLHHLTPDAKQSLLAKCRGRLNPGGVLAVIDVFLQPGENRDEYIQRWHHNARQQFLQLADRELDILLDHVAARDLPESISTYRRLAQSAGFADVRVVREGPERLNQLVLLS
ncbi:MAG: class I SAM-dependent methyltransferase [Pseudomonadota bacterium]